MYLYVIFFFFYFIINYEVLLENVLQENIIYLSIGCVYNYKLYNQIFEYLMK